MLISHLECGISNGICCCCCCPAPPLPLPTPTEDAATESGCCIGCSGGCSGVRGGGAAIIATPPPLTPTEAASGCKKFRLCSARSACWAKQRARTSGNASNCS